MKVDYERLIQLALDARKNAHSPYSNFSVGASLLCEDGTVYTGCNIENSSFSETACAERVAIFKAVSEGKRDFLAICIVAGKERITDFVYPCGACRQVLSEFCKADFEVILFNGKEHKSISLDSLLPKSFTSVDIK